MNINIYMYIKKVINVNLPALPINSKPKVYVTKTRNCIHLCLGKCMYALCENKLIDYSIELQNRVFMLLNGKKDINELFKIFEEYVIIMKGGSKNGGNN